MSVMLPQGFKSYWSPKSQLIPTAHVLGIFYACLGGGQLASHLGKVKRGRPASCLSSSTVINTDTKWPRPHVSENLDQSVAPTLECGY